jgi:hypothetical protein
MAVGPDFLVKIVLIGDLCTGKTEFLSPFTRDTFSTDSKYLEIHNRRGMCDQNG